LIATAGGIVLTGGGGGVMRAAMRGASAAGGHTIGILPDARDSVAELAVVSDMKDGRNYLNAFIADVLIALYGEAGTLSEIGLALKIGTPLVYLGHWRFLNENGLPSAPYVESAAEAVSMAFALLHLAPHERIDRPVKCPTIPDQSERLARLAAQVALW
jgi:predicted Rossmann-fold nucleotide-binding protein